MLHGLVEQSTHLDKAEPSKPTKATETAEPYPSCVRNRINFRIHFPFSNTASLRNDTKKGMYGKSTDAANNRKKRMKIFVFVLCERVPATVGFVLHGLVERSTALWYDKNHNTQKYIASCFAFQTIKWHLEQRKEARVLFYGLKL